MRVSLTPPTLTGGYGINERVARNGWWPGMEWEEISGIVWKLW